MHSFGNLMAQSLGVQSLGWALLLSGILMCINWLSSWTIIIYPRRLNKRGCLTKFISGQHFLKNLFFKQYRSFILLYARFIFFNEIGNFLSEWTYNWWRLEVRTVEMLWYQQRLSFFEWNQVAFLICLFGLVSQ